MIIASEVVWRQIPSVPRTDCSAMTCGEYHNHLLNCKTCQALAHVYFAQRAGSVTSTKKAKASRKNGKKGGRSRLYTR